MWNSPFSPQGSTAAEVGEERASKSRPANDGASLLGSTQVTTPVAGVDELARERRVSAPRAGRERGSSPARELSLAVGADVLEEEVAEGDPVSTIFASRFREGALEPVLVTLPCCTREREQHLDELDPKPLRWRGK